jgi:ArsR family transcriptional regulator
MTRDSDDTHGDAGRLSELLKRREDRHTLNERLLEPGQSWAMWARALAFLLPPLDVVDFGCGTGVLTVELARWAKRVTAVDRSPQALHQAEARAEREGLKNVAWLEADLHDLPIASGKKELVVASQSLHHVDAPNAVLAEAARILEPGGKVVVLELMPHREEWVRERLGHKHLGFEPDVLEEQLVAAGFRHVQLTPAPRDGGSPFRAFLLTGDKK